MEEAREGGVVKYKESIGYQIAIGYAVTKFLVKEKIKIKRLIKKAHNIEDLSCLENIDLEPTFSCYDEDEEEEGEEVEWKVEQNEPPRQSSLKQPPSA